jgi:hypothetical protein
MSKNEIFHVDLYDELVGDVLALEDQAHVLFERMSDGHLDLDDQDIWALQGIMRMAMIKRVMRLYGLQGLCGKTSARSKFNTLTVKGSGLSLHRQNKKKPLTHSRILNDQGLRQEPIRAYPSHTLTE